MNIYSLFPVSILRQLESDIASAQPQSLSSLAVRDFIRFCVDSRVCRPSTLQAGDQIRISFIVLSYRFYHRVRDIYYLLILHKVVD